ncbi:MAG: hypothetical protein U5K84_04945 [Alkalibacterium sp.]|nr:hypothetical protein [Alkalibacterium sp.]
MMPLKGLTSVFASSWIFKEVENMMHTGNDKHLARSADQYTRPDQTADPAAKTTRSRMTSSSEWKTGPITKSASNTHDQQRSEW